MISLLAILLSGVGAEADLASPHDVFGRWFTNDHQSVIEITDCGDGTPCGRVSWRAGDPDGSTKDTANKDRALRDRPLLGAELLSDFRAGDDQWTGGQIYNPENGRTYRAIIQRIDDSHLSVKGCVGPICKGFVWEAAK